MSNPRECRQGSQFVIRNSKFVIDEVHPEYQELIHQWSKCRDAYRGEDAIKAKGEIYLPRLSGQESSQTEYQAYQDRACFYGVLSNTVSAHGGAAFTTPPVIDVEYHSEIESWAQNTDNTHTNLIDHMRETLDEVLVVGRHLLFVDIEEGNQEPYLVRRTAEDIINWSEGSTGKLERVILRERRWDISPEDPYQAQQVERFRELMLEHGTYKQRIWEQSSTSSDFQLKQELIPKKNGKHLDFLPVVVFGVENLSCSPSKPPLLDMVNLNLAHYRNSADYEQVLHSLACGTPYIFGVPDEELPQEFGPDTLWSNHNPDVKVGVLEFSGCGITALKEAMEEKKQAMVALGAKLIERQRKQVESAETARLRSASEHSTLSKMVDTLGAGYEKLLEYVCFWKSCDVKPRVKMSHDFINDTWQPSEVTALNQAFTEGLISHASYFHALQTRDFYKDSWSEELERKAIESDQHRSQQKNTIN